VDRGGQVLAAKAVVQAAKEDQAGRSGQAGRSVIRSS